MPSDQPANFQTHEGNSEQTATYCYVIHFAGDHKSYWTKFDRPVVIEDGPPEWGSGSQTFSPVPISHGAIENTAEFTARPTAVSIIATNELRLFFATAATAKINIHIYRVNHAGLTNPDNPTVFDEDVFEVASGVLDSIQISGLIITGNIIPEPFYMNRLVPRYCWQRQCNHRLYDLDTCKAVKGNFKFETTLQGFTRTQREVQINGTHGGDAPLSFAGGYLVHVPSGLFFSVSKEDEFSGDTYLRLTSWNAVLEQIGDNVRVFRGCNHTLEDCEAFGRKASFGGFPFIPNKNPTIHGI